MTSPQLSSSSGTTSTQRRAELMLFLVTFVWGSTFVISKGLLEGNSPLWYTAFRFAASTLVVLIVFPRRILRMDRASFRHGMVLGALLYAGFITQTIGLLTTTASKSAFFTGLLTVLTPLVQFATRRWRKKSGRAITVGNLLGVVFATLGLYLLTSPGGSGFNSGDALTILCALFFAGYIVYLDEASTTADPYRTSFAQFLFCAAVGFPVAFVFESMRVTATPGFFLSFGYLVLFATVITMIIQVRFQGETTPTRAGIIFAMEPVVAGFLAYFVRSETLSAIGIVGAIVVVAGLLLSELSGLHPLLGRAMGGESVGNAVGEGTTA